MNDPDARAAPRDSFLAFQILFFLRFIQLGSTVLTGFIACYFVWWHNRLHDEVPSGLIIVICACLFAFLENYFSSAYGLSRGDRYPNYGLLRKTTISSSAAMIFGYWSLRQVPFVRKWCEGDNWFRPVSYGGNVGVEEHHCALTCDIIVAGAIAVSFTVFLAIFAIVGGVGSNKANSVKLDEGPYDYSDELLKGHGATAKDLTA